MRPRFFYSLNEIHPWSLAVRSQLNLCCHDCGKTGTFTPHGWLFAKKQSDGVDAIGKRVICNPSSKYGGCGRTMRLLPKTEIHRLHQNLGVLDAFIKLLISGLSIALAYGEASGSHSSRQAGRWWKALRQNEGTLREDHLKRKGESALLEEPTSATAASSRLAATNNIPSASLNAKRQPSPKTRPFRELLANWWKQAQQECICPIENFQLLHQKALLTIANSVI